MSSGECVKTLEGHTSYILSIEQLAQDLLVSSSADGTVKIWHLASAQCVRTIKTSSPAYVVEPIAIDRLATGGDHGIIHIWNATSGSCERLILGHSAAKQVTSLKLISNNRLASGCMDGTVKIWYLVNGDCISTFRQHEQFGVASLELVGLDIIAAGLSNGAINVFNAINGMPIRTLHFSNDMVNVLKLVGSDRLASGFYSDMGVIRINNLKNGESDFQYLHTKTIVSLEMAGHQRLVTGAIDSLIKVWDLSDFKCMLVIHANVTNFWKNGFKYLYTIR